MIRVKSTDGTLMRPNTVPVSDKGTVSSHEKRPRLDRGRALEETKSMKQSELDDYQYSGEYPWRSEDVLKELYHEKNLTQEEIAKRLGCHRKTITKWVATHRLEKPDGGPWDPVENIADADLHDLYWNKGKTTIEIAEMFDCGATSVRRYMDDQGVERRGSLTRHYHRTPTHRFREDGYETLQINDGGSQHSVRIHRLVAVAEYGIEAVKGKHVHHKDKHPANNSPENLELMDPDEHALHHMEERIDKLIVNEKGIVGWER